MILRNFLVLANGIAGGFFAFLFYAAASDFRFRGFVEFEAYQCSDARTTMWIAGATVVFFWIGAGWIRWQGRVYA